MEDLKNAFEFGAKCGLISMPFIFTYVFFDLNRHGWFKKIKDKDNDNDKSIKG